VDEPRILGCRIRKIRKPKLLNATEALELRTTDNPLLEQANRDQLIQRVRYDIGVDELMWQQLRLI
jgi:hypothetical protein